MRISDWSSDVCSSDLLMRMAGNDAILILPAAPERVRSRDTHYPYRQDSDLLYLAGFPEPEAVLVLVPGRKHGENLLFCRYRDPAREAWDAPRAGPEAPSRATAWTTLHRSWSSTRTCPASSTAAPRGPTTASARLAVGTGVFDRIGYRGRWF